MKNDPKSAIISILDKSNKTVGTGFIISPEGHMVTCAHVLKEIDSNIQMEDLVTVTLYQTQKSYSVKVLKVSGKTDIAILHLNESPPPDVINILFESIPSSSYPTDDWFISYGFPELSPAGEGALCNYVTNIRTEFIQIRSEEITKGFSGAPLWHSGTNNVIGMISEIREADKYGRRGKTAFAITPNNISEFCGTVGITLEINESIIVEQESPKLFPVSLMAEEQEKPELLQVPPEGCPAFTQLRNKLSALYATGIQQFIQQFDFELPECDFEQPAHNIWQTLLRWLVHNNGLSALMNKALSDFANDPELEEPWMRLNLTLILEEINQREEIHLELYRKYRKDTALENKRDPKAIYEIVDWLWQIINVNGTREKAVCFAEGMAQLISGSQPRLSEKLNQWSDRLVEFISGRINSQNVARIRELLATPDHQEPVSSTYLMVDLHPSLLDSVSENIPKFQVTMYLWVNGEFVDQLDAGSCTLTDLPQKVYEACRDRFSSQKPDVIEFFVPMPLLAHLWDKNFDQMQFKLQRRGRTNQKRLLRDYQINIRSWDRQYNKDTRELSEEVWPLKWDHFQYEDQRPLHERISYFSLDDFLDGDKLDRLDKVLPNQGDKSLIGLKISKLEKAFQEAADDFFWINLEAGTPILLWSRQSACGHRDDIETLREILSATNISPGEFPQIVHELRHSNEANDDKNHLGKHLNFFWDDPTRNLIREYETSFLVTQKLGG